MVGDVRDPIAVRQALRGVDVVYHFAARVGVGQSMYEVSDYISVNTQGAAVLLEQLIQCRVEQLIVASSMSVYGEGLYQLKNGKIAETAPRTIEQLKAGDWEVCTAKGEPLYARPTPETKPPSLSSVYALSKFDQEQICL